VTFWNHEHTKTVEVQYSEIGQFRHDMPFCESFYH
jgi:hypothetical protein